MELDQHVFEKLAFFFKRVVNFFHFDIFLLFQGDNCHILHTIISKHELTARDRLVFLQNLHKLTEVELLGCELKVFEFEISIVHLKLVVKIC